MRTANDLMLILDQDPDSVGILCEAAEILGCDRIEVDNLRAASDLSRKVG